MTGRADAIDREDGDGSQPPVLSRALEQDLEDLVDKYLAATARCARINVDEFVRAELPADADSQERAELRRRLIAFELLRDAARTEADGRGAPSDSGPAGHVWSNGDNGVPPVTIGRYRVLDCLAHSHASVVYRAFDPKFDREVALKVTRTDRNMSPEDAERWKRDARVVAQLRHPNIVPYHEAGEAGEIAYIDMELVRGISLEEKLRTAPCGRLPPREAARIVRKVAEALHYAHGHKIIHRDVKPSNILIDEEGEPQLVDFGLARRLGGEKTLTRTDQVLGTPAYLSPEQARGQSHTVTGQSDIFSLGVVLYRLLTGRLPFDDAECGTMELLGRIVHAAPTPPTKLVPSTPPDLELICLKALEKLPEDRYASAGEMADDLGRWQGDVPIRCRRVSAWDRSRRWCKRNPVIASLTIGFVASLVIGMAATSFYAHRALVRERESQFRLYAADMHLAQQYIQNNFVGGAVALLEKHRGGTGPDGYLGWEWHYLRRQCHPELRQFGVNATGSSGDASAVNATGSSGGALRSPLVEGSVNNPREGIDGAVLSVAFSPDGRTLAAAGESGLVCLWETATGELLRKLKGPKGEVNQIAFHPEGRLIAAAGDDHIVWVWNAETGQRAAALHGHEQPLDAVAFSPHGRLLATGGQDELTVRVWDTSDWTPLAVLETGRGCSLAFDTQSQHLAIGGADGRIRIVSLADAKVTRVLNNLANHRGGVVAKVHAVAFSHDGALLAAAGPSRRVTVWNTIDWSEAASLTDSTADVLAIAFDRDGRRLAVAGRDSVIRIWDLAAPALRPLVLKGHTSHVMSVAFAPDGWRLASASADGTVRLWDTYAATEFDSLPTLRHHAQSVSFSPDGNTLATAAYGVTISLWGGPAFSIVRDLHTAGDANLDVAFSPDGRQLAAVDLGGYLKSFDTRTLDQKWRRKLSEGPLGAVAFSRDGKLIVAGGNGKIIRFTDAGDGRELFTAKGHSGNVNALEFDATGRLVASAGNDGTVRIWNASDGTMERIIAAHMGEALCIAPHPRRPLVASGSSDETIRLWDIRTGDEVRTFRGHAGPVWAVKFSPDGRRLFSGSSDGTVKVWDVESGLELCTLAGHSHWVRDLDVHPDGWSLVSTGKDHETRIWDARPHRGLAQFAQVQEQIVPVPLSESSEQTVPVPLSEDGFRIGSNREAVGLVRFLASRFRTAAPTLRAIRSDATISDAVRNEAEDLARHYPYHLAYIEEGHRAAETEGWPSAVSAFQRAVELAPRDAFCLQWLALAQLGARDLAGFAQTRDTMLRQFGEHPTESEAFLVLYTCLIVPPHASILDSLSPIVSDYARWFPNDPWPSILFDLRTGNVPTLVLEKPQDAARVLFDQFKGYILALSYYRAGKLADARYFSELADRRATQGKSDWDINVFADTLRREVLELLESANEGEDTPSIQPSEAANDAD
jgi:WD40 repeat protein/serine/threonine protein kinase